MWRGYEGAVATSAASAPVGVGPAGSTCVGKREGKTFVGEVGGNLCTSVDPAQGWARASSSACARTVSLSLLCVLDKEVGELNQCWEHIRT